jgi:hypothetical protein
MGTAIRERGGTDCILSAMARHAPAILLTAFAFIHGALGQPHSVRQLAAGVYVWQGGPR